MYPRLALLFGEHKLTLSLSSSAAGGADVLVDLEALVLIDAATIVGTNLYLLTVSGSELEILEKYIPWTADQQQPPWPSSSCSW